MARREELSALENLLRLVNSDLEQVDDETLAEGIRSAEYALDHAQEWSGQMVARLKKRMSWTELAKLTGLPQATLVRRARPYL